MSKLNAPSHHFTELPRREMYCECDKVRGGFCGGCKKRVAHQLALIEHRIRPREEMPEEIEEGPIRGRDVDRRGGVRRSSVAALCARGSNCLALGVDAKSACSDGDFTTKNGEELGELRPNPPYNLLSGEDVVARAWCRKCWKIVLSDQDRKTWKLD